MKCANKCSYFASLLLAGMMACQGGSAMADNSKSAHWKVGDPIVTYWAGPAMTDTAAQQIADGNWNLCWCSEKELDVAKRHGLRAQLMDGLLAPETLDDPVKKAALDALISRVKDHPALYDYFITDEPDTSRFAGLGRLVAYLREKDPAHLAYINLLPTYATNEQLGTIGDTVTAYNAYLKQFIDVVKPGLISWDHYQFAIDHDMPDYFLNLSLIRTASLNAKLPFLNIIQAATWTPKMREPNEGEMRYLIFTSAAYGAQGISYYVYNAPGHSPCIAKADGTPTPVYYWLKKINPEFATIASELKTLHSTGVYHAGMLPPGAVSIPAKFPFNFDPPIPAASFEKGLPVTGALLGGFSKRTNGRPSHVVVVNLDYKKVTTVTVTGPGHLEVFDTTNKVWRRSSEPGHITLRLEPGGGQLVRSVK